jgi:hypothetical protein
MLDADSRPKWPYAIGLLGGLAFGLAAWLLGVLALEESRSVGLGKLAVWGMAAGGAALGVAWIGIFQQKQCGFGVIGGSLAVPVAIVYLYANRNNWGLLGAHGMILMVALAGCALGYVFLRGMRLTRAAAALALLGFIIEIVAHQKKLRLSDGNRSLVTILSFGSLGLMGITTALEMLRLQTAPTEDASL